MATDRITRTDDTAATLQNIATVSFTEDAVTNHAQQVVLVDATTPTQKHTIDASGNAQAILAANSGTDVGDVTVNNASGASAVNVQDGGNTLTVDNGGTFATQVDGDALTALQLIDNPVVVDDAAFTPATTSVMMAGAEFDDTAPDSVDEGDGGALRMSANRNLYTTLRDAAGNERGANINASNQLSTSVDNSPTLGANSGVDIGDVDVTSITGVTMSNAAMQTTGDEAHDAVDAGNPVKIGAKAVEVSATPTAVAASDRTDLLANRHGMLHTIGGGFDTFTTEAVVLDADGAQTNVSMRTVAAGTAIVVTKIAVSVDEACTVGVSVRIGLATATLPAEATTGTDQVLFHHAGIVPGGGATVGDGSGILGIGATNEDLRYTCDDPVGGELSIVVSGFEIAI